VVAFALVASRQFRARHPACPHLHLPAVFRQPAPAVVGHSTTTLLSNKMETSVQTLFVLGFIILTTFLVGMIVGFIAGRYSLFRKYRGEAMLANVIATNFSRPHVLLNNVTLKTNDGTTQIDHVLITDMGIFVIETKHYDGWIFGDPQSRQWTQTIYRKKSRFQNPIHQNFGHVKALVSLFNLPNDNFHSVVVFTGNAEFKTDPGPGVIHLPDLISFLSADRPVVFDERKIAYVVGRIEMKRERRSVETDEYHINYVRRRLTRK
jgi:restriction system protein